MKLLGNYTALITPFNKKEEIDYITLTKLILMQLDKGSSGIVALGSTAESPTLDSYEKKKIMETIVSECKNKMQIIAGVNAFSLQDALNQCYARFFDGADALLVSPPPYIKPTQNQLLNYYQEIADHSFIPIILYNIPSRTSISISYDTCKKLSSHPNIIGIKEASGNMNLAFNLSAHCLNDNFALLSGNDDLLIPHLSLGAKGIISVIGNIDPQICEKTISLYRANQTTKAVEFYQQYTELINALSLETNPIPIKQALSALKLTKAYWRKPLSKPNNKTSYAIKSALNNLFIN